MHLTFTLVDKNLLIPEISASNDYFDIITQLYKKVYQRDLTYCSNVYIVKYDNSKFDSIIQFENNTFYSIIDNSKIILDINLNNIFIQTNTSERILSTFAQPIKEVKEVK